MKDRMICIIQARVGSTRLPNKVLMDLRGMSMLERVVYRTYASSQCFDDLIIATGVNKENDIIEDICKDHNWKCVRHNEDDVLDRFYYTANITNADHIIRICADDPFIDPNVIAKSVGIYKNNNVDYVGTETVPPRTYPLGMAVEVFSRKSLDIAWRKTRIEREHVTPYIWKNPGEFKIMGVSHERDLSNIKLTVDTLEDYRGARYLYSKFKNADFHWLDAVWYLERRDNGVD